MAAEREQIILLKRNAHLFFSHFENENKSRVSGANMHNEEGEREGPTFNARFHQCEKDAKDCGAKYFGPVFGGRM